MLHFYLLTPLAYKMLCRSNFSTDFLTISDVDEVIQSQFMDQPTQATMPSVPVLQYNTEPPYVRIIEQPASRHLRFRYECEIEGRSAGSIVGANNTAENRTYPTIQVMNHQGPFAVVVSCVSKEGPPYRPHPHNIVGREGCKRGVCTLVVNSPDMTCSFTGLGIQCVKRRDIEKSLQIRETHKLDPYGTGFTHRTQPGSIDLNVLRLCFQVFIRGPDNNFSMPLPPVVSEMIYDKKAMSDLTIMKLSHYSAPVTGGTDVILLCDRVAREDIQIWFYEEQGTRVTWESQAEFQPSDVHKQVAISFHTPRYYNQSINQPVPVFIELRRPSDNLRGDPRPFQFLPMERDPEGLARKRFKMEESFQERYLQESVLAGSSTAQEHHVPIGVPRTLRQPSRQRIKPEPISVTGGAVCGEPFNMNPLPHGMSDYAQSVMDSVSVQIATQSTSPHLTPAHSPALGTSPGTHSHSPVSPPLLAAHSPNMPTMNMPPQPTDAVKNIKQISSNIRNTVDDAFIEKLDSLDLDVDPDLTDLNLNLTQNLSASLFDSANNVTDTMFQDAIAQQDQNMPSEDSLTRISRIHNDLDELSKLQWKDEENS